MGKRIFPRAYWLLVALSVSHSKAFAVLSTETRTLVVSQRDAAIDAVNAAGAAIGRSIAAQRRLSAGSAGTDGIVGSRAPTAEDLVAFSNATDDVEGRLQTAYVSIEMSCATNLGVLNAALSADEKKSAHINAWGGLIALIGGVTVYAPAKVLLMGIGISSSGGSNSVLGGLAGSFTTDAAANTQAIASMKQAYASAVSTYEAIPVVQDVLGIARFRALVRIQASCDGLLSAGTQDSPPASPTSK